MLNPRNLLQELNAELNEAEQKRLYHYRRIRPFRIGFNLGMTVTAGLIIYAFIFPDEGATAAGIAGAIFMFSLVVYGIKHSSEQGQFKDHFQRHVVEKIIPKLGLGFSYQARGGFPQQRLEESSLFGYFNRHQSEDFVSGKISGRTISFAEVKLERQSGSDSNKSKTVFSGIYLEVKLAQRFMAPCWLVRKRKSLSENKSAHEVKLAQETQTLTGKYKLYSENKDFARELFTAEVLRKLIAVNSDLRSRKVIWGNLAFAFIDDSIRIALNMRRKFMEPDLFKAVNTEAFLEKELAVLSDCARLVEVV